MCMNPELLGEVEQQLQKDGVEIFRTPVMTSNTKNKRDHYFSMDGCSFQTQLEVMANKTCDNEEYQLECDKKGICVKLKVKRTEATEKLSNSYIKAIDKFNSLDWKVIYQVAGVDQGKGHMESDMSNVVAAARKLESGPFPRYKQDKRMAPFDQNALPTDGTVL
ncbi:unnamed protein product [Cylicocyclus nassatus]|uniref:Uncharacterized protein n=1 Tax=Cylicocyclus nassatus TaxID=53992 RepID=A0AA36MEV0_CYLNA|nr:unnamed protein product [Cylicocyclus nassatus]